MSELAYHESILSLLRSLATLNEQVGPTELICLWFDDLYFPAQTCPENYSKEVWERGQRGWRECFSDSELVVLAHFHEIFYAEVDNLTEVLEEYKQDPGWLRVSSAAAIALKGLNAEAHQSAPADVGASAPPRQS